MDTDSQKKYYLSDHLERTGRPWDWSEFWTADTCPAIQKLQKNRDDESYPSVSHFSGLRGTGKSSAARVRGMEVNCLKIFETGQRKPCGQCKGCLKTHISEGFARGRYFELNGARQGQLSESLDYAIDQARMYGRATGKVSAVIAIDEADRLSSDLIQLLHKFTEDYPKIHFIIITQLGGIKNITSSLKDRLRYHYEFKTPSRIEVRNGIQKIAAKLGTNLTDSQVDWMLGRSEVTPREALAILEQHLQVNV